MWQSITGHGQKLISMIVNWQVQPETGACKYCLRCMLDFRLHHGRVCRRACLSTQMWSGHVDGVNRANAFMLLWIRWTARHRCRQTRPCVLLGLAWHCQLLSSRVHCVFALSDFAVVIVQWFYFGWFCSGLLNMIYYAVMLIWGMLLALPNTGRFCSFGDQGLWFWEYSRILQTLVLQQVCIGGGCLAPLITPAQIKTVFGQFVPMCVFAALICAVSLQYWSGWNLLTQLQPLCMLSDPNLKRLELEGNKFVRNLSLYSW